MCDREFQIYGSSEVQDFVGSFNHLRSLMAECAGAGLMQQRGQDLALWKCFWYTYCARGRKSWLCRTHQAHHVEEDTLFKLEAKNRFEGGHHRLMAEAVGLWSFRLKESWVIYKNLNMYDQDFRFLEIQKVKTSWVLFHHSWWRSVTADCAGAGLKQQSGQDLASWKRFLHIYCARGKKSWPYRTWLYRTYRAHHVEEDTLLEANRFEGGHDR